MVFIGLNWTLKSFIKVIMSTWTEKESIGSSIGCGVFKGLKMFIIIFHKVCSKFEKRVVNKTSLNFYLNSSKFASETPQPKNNWKCQS